MTYPPPQDPNQPQYGPPSYPPAPGFGGGSYGPPPSGPPPYEPGRWDQPPPPPGGNRIVVIAVVIAVLVVAGGIGAAFALTGGSSSKQADRSTSPGPSTSATSFPSTTAGTSVDPVPDVSTGTTPTSADTSATSKRSCSRPAGTTAAPNLKPTGVLTDLLGADATLPSPTLVTPAVQYTTTVSSGTVNTLCYDNVAQSDLIKLVAFFGGAGYKQTDGKIPAQQQIFTSSNSLTPKLVALSVTGTLKISDSVFDDLTGSLEVDWEN